MSYDIYFIHSNIQSNANITVGPNGMYAGGGVLGGADAVALTDIGGGVWEGSCS